MGNTFVLSKKDKAYIEGFKSDGPRSLRVFNRATILIFLDKGGSISDIQNLLDVDRTIIWRVKTRFLEHGVEYVLVDNERSRQPKKYTADHEAELIALACGPAPDDRRRWTIRLLVEELQRREGFETITFETITFETITFETITFGIVRSILKKTHLGLG